MKYSVTHTTTYTYPQPVQLEPHVLRLRPRCDGYQHLHQYDLQIEPQSAGITHTLDAEGTLVTHCWWPSTPTAQLKIVSLSLVETLCPNPFNYLLDFGVTRLPIDYPTALRHALQPYLSPHPLTPPAPIAVQLAQELGDQVDWNPVDFLHQLNQQIHDRCRQEIRETGDPQSPSYTWLQQVGCCRDFVVLFMAVCRAVGLAARFVSGYEEGDPIHEKYLHAWVEVYLPGAGWRGYDPTLGIAVSDRHIAIAASGWFPYASPVSGTHRGGRTAAGLESSISIRPLEGNDLS